MVYFSVCGILLTTNIVAAFFQHPLPNTHSSTRIWSASTDSDAKAIGVRRAKELLKELIVDDRCYSSVAGARKFGECCAIDCVYEDRFQPQPFVGRRDVTDHIVAKVEARKDRGGLRLDRISDGDQACGFAWTYTTDNEEGLRGTTFVELNSKGEIAYVREIPEPLFKPGDMTLELLKAVTEGATFPDKPEYEKRTPTVASDIAKYLFQEVQGSDIDESMRFFDNNIVYRDFNYEEVLRGPAEVRKFIEDFTIPGIYFRLERVDDGIDSTCFTWEVQLEGQEDTVKGISLYEVDPETRLVKYVRDVPESAIKPPILGKLARDFRPGLGVFEGVPLGSRPGGM